MRFLKSLLFCMCLVVSSSSTFAVGSAVVNLFEALTKKGGPEQVLSTNFFNRSTVSKLSRSLELALGDFKKGKLTIADLKKMKMRSTVLAEDKPRFDRMIKALEGKADLDQKEMIQVYHDILHLSQRYGARRSAIQACVSCLDNELSKEGIEYVLVEFKDNKQANKILSHIQDNAPNPKRARDWMSKEAKSQKLGGIGSFKSVDEEEAYMFFISIPKKGNKKMRDLYNEILNVSRTNFGEGSVKLFDDANPHKLFTIFENDLDDAGIEHWTSMLKDTHAIMKRDKVPAQEAFEKMLTERIDKLAKEKNLDDAEVQDLIAKRDFIIEKKCFMRGK